MEWAKGGMLDDANPKTQRPHDRDWAVWNHVCALGSEFSWHRRHSLVARAAEETHCCKAGDTTPPTELVKQVPKSTRGGVGLPPGPLRGPARSWLTTLGSTSNADDRLSWSALCAETRNPYGTIGSRRDTSGESGAGVGIHRNWRAARRPRVRQRIRSQRILRLSARHPPHEPDAYGVAARHRCVLRLTT